MSRLNVTPFKLMLALTAGAALCMSACTKKEDSGGASDATSELETKTASAATFNATCPMMDGNEVSADAGSVEFNGKTIGFCCEECLGSWNEMTDQEKSDKFAELQQALEEAGDEMKDKAEDAMDDVKDKLPGEGDGG